MEGKLPKDEVLRLLREIRLGQPNVRDVTKWADAFFMMALVLDRLDNRECTCYGLHDDWESCPLNG